jgi:urease accessory protein
MASLPPDQSALERHVLYILLDSNLPTGGFVASSGLESYAKHGFFSSSHLASLSDAQGSARAAGVEIQEAVVDFAQSSVMNYAKSTLAFVKDAWTLLDRLQTAEAGDQSKETTVAALKKLDDLYEAMTLNHVTRRSSTAQGIALLTLLTKGFAPPNLNFPARSTKASVMEEEEEEEVPLWWKSSVDTFKRMIRRGEAHGHLPVCWGVLTRAMGLSLGGLLLPIFILCERLS